MKRFLTLSLAAAFLAVAQVSAVSINGGTTSAPATRKLSAPTQPVVAWTPSSGTANVRWISGPTDAGNTTRFDCLVDTSNGTFVNDYQLFANPGEGVVVNWVSSNTSVATVTSSGYVSWVSNGSVNITAIAGSTRQKFVTPLTEATYTSSVHSFNGWASGTLMNALKSGVDSLLTLSHSPTTQNIFTNISITTGTGANGGCNFTGSPLVVGGVGTLAASSATRNTSCFINGLSGLTGMSIGACLSYPYYSSISPCGATLIASDIIVVARHTGIGAVGANYVNGLAQPLNYTDSSGVVHSYSSYDQIRVNPNGTYPGTAGTSAVLFVNRSNQLMPGYVIENDDAYNSAGNNNPTLGSTTTGNIFGDYMLCLLTAPMDSSIDRLPVMPANYFNYLGWFNKESTSDTYWPNSFYSVTIPTIVTVQPYSLHGWSPLLYGRVAKVDGMWQFGARQSGTGGTYISGEASVIDTTGSAPAVGYYPVYYFQPQGMSALEQSYFVPLQGGDSGNANCVVLGSQLIPLFAYHAPGGPDIASLSNIVSAGTYGTSLNARIAALRAAAHAVNSAWGTGTDYPTVVNLSAYPTF